MRPVRQRLNKAQPFRPEDKMLGFSLRGARDANHTPTQEGHHLLQLYNQHIEFVPHDQLIVQQRIMRTHSAKQRRKLANIIRKLGVFNPIIVDENLRILSGHLRADVAADLGLDEVPVIQIRHLSDREKRLFVLAANRIGEDAGWDSKMLAAETGELIVALNGSVYEINDSGFELAEIDALAIDHSDCGGGAADDVIPPRQPAQEVSRLGDLWQLGAHRLKVGDARRLDDHRSLMGETTARTAITDVPYNVSIRNHARRTSSHGEFAMASGEMSDAKYNAFLRGTFANMAASLVDGGIAYAFIDWRHASMLEQVGREVIGDFKNLCVWVKSNAGMGTFYRSRHELILVFKKGKAPHVNTFELGQHGRSRTNVWEYAGVTSFKSGRRAELDYHPTVKPVAMIADAMLDCSARGDVVLDPFVGSGTTIIAAEKTGRCAYAMEIDPTYTDVSIRRWQDYTGRDAILSGTGETFEQVEQCRCASALNDTVEDDADEAGGGDDAEE